MKKFIRFTACIAALMMAFAFTSCSSSSDSSTGSYTTVSGGTYSSSGYTFTFTFNADKSVTGSVGGLSLDGYVWEESGKTVTVKISGQTTAAYTFTANNYFTKLTYDPSGSGYGTMELSRQ